MSAIGQLVEISERTDWRRLLDEAAESPLRLKQDGIIYRLERETADLDSTDQADAERVLRILDETLGSWADLDIQQLLDELYEARRVGSRPPDRP